MANLGVDLIFGTDDDAETLVAWARGQLEHGCDEDLVFLWALLAIGDLLVDGQVELPDLRDIIHLI